MPTEAWRTNNATLAGLAVPDDEWHELDSIYDSLIAMRYGLFAGASFTPADIDDLGDRIQRVLIDLGYHRVSAALVGPSGELKP